MLGFVAGFLPWIVMSLLARRGLAVAAGSGLSVAVLLSGRRLASGRAKLFEKAGLVYLGAMLLCSSASFVPRDPALITALGNLALASLAFVSLVVGRPFITEYAREIEPERLWEHPVFLHGTRRLTLAWTLVLLTIAGLEAASHFAGRWRWLLRWPLPFAVLFTAIKASQIYRVFLRRWQNAQIAEAAAEAPVKSDPGETAPHRSV